MHKKIILVSGLLLAFSAGAQDSVPLADESGSGPGGLAPDGATEKRNSKPLPEGRVCGPDGCAPAPIHGGFKTRGITAEVKKEKQEASSAVPDKE